MALPSDPDAPVYEALRREITIKNTAAAGRSLGRALTQFGEIVNAFATGITEGMREGVDDDDESGDA